MTAKGRARRLDRFAAEPDDWSAALGKKRRDADDQRGAQLQNTARRVRRNWPCSEDYFAVTQSVCSGGGWVKVCITTQYCSVFSRRALHCSGVALGAVRSKRTRRRSKPTGTS